MKNDTNFSKYLAYILRHHPEEIGLELTDNGWVCTDSLVRAVNAHSKYDISRADLERIVANDGKQRYSFSPDGTKIRANQGHSVKDLKMEFKKAAPPRYLYHGTSKKALPAIVASGELKPMSRQMLHLSSDIETAVSVGSRHGKPVVLRIDTERALQEGKQFYISENGVYLVDQIDIHLCKMLESLQGEAAYEKDLDS